MSKLNKNEEKLSFDLERYTRAILLIGIILVSGGIMYFLLLPPEEFQTFIILNEEKKMADYPINASLGEEVHFHLFVQSNMVEETDYLVNVSRGNNNTVINTTTGAENIHFIQNFTFTLKYEENWTSPEISVIFPEIGHNQTIIAELWKKEDSGWIFIPNQILFLRLTIY